MWIADKWKDYEVLDCGDGEKLERWGEVILRRPDPQVIWPKQQPEIWESAHAWYHRSDRGGGAWETFLPMPEKWTITYQDVSFFVKPTGFKHTGLFPEQAVNWEWMRAAVEKRKAQTGNAPQVLNLFAYTGGASLACARAGAQVCHVDAAKSMQQWARENAALSKAEGIRWIVDDALKFVLREIRREKKYDGILMDPPSYGRGPAGEVWKLEEELYGLVHTCAQALTDRPLFFLMNSYTTGLSASVLANLLHMTVARKHGGGYDAQEVGLPVTSGGVLPCGASGRWLASE